MAHFAQIDENNVVTQVLVVPDREESRGHDYLATDMGLGGTWVQTSYNATIRKNYAGIGYTFDEARDAFIPPKANCHPEETLDEATCRYTCPDASHVIIIGEE